MNSLIAHLQPSDDHNMQLPAKNTLDHDAFLYNYFFAALKAMRIPYSFENSSQSHFQMTLEKIVQLFQLLDALKFMRECDPSLPALQNLTTVRTQYTQPETEILTRKRTNKLVYSENPPNQEENTTDNSAELQLLAKIEDDPSPKNALLPETGEIGSINLFSYDLEFGFATLKKLENVGYLKILPNTKALELINSVDPEISNFYLKGEKNSKAKASSSSSFMKNFSKTLGDHFADYLDSSLKLNVKRAFKDKTSLKLLNQYFEGSKKIDDLSTKTLVVAFVEFLGSEKREQIDKSKIKDKGLRICYKLLMENLKGICSIVNTHDLRDKLSSMKIIKLWPALDVEIKWESHGTCCAQTRRIIS